MSDSQDLSSVKKISDYIFLDSNRYDKSQEEND